MTTAEKPKTQAPTMTSSEVLASLTGYDELAIEQHFGKPIEGMTGTPSKFGRALVFVLKRREGLNDGQAKKYVLELTMGAVDDHFAPDEDDELPGSEAGKDES